MTEEQAAELLDHLAALRVVVALGVKVLCWLIGYCLYRVAVGVVSSGSGLFGRPKL